MIRWIVGTSLKFRFIVLADRRGADALRHRAAAPACRWTSFPSSRRHASRFRPSASDFPRRKWSPWSPFRWSRRSTGWRGSTSCAPSRSPTCRRSSCSSSPAPTILRARQLVQERLATVLPTLPTWAAPPVMMPPVSTTGRFMKIGLSSKTMSLIDMSMIAYWTIRARLLRVPGVANVAIWGERIKMPQVQVDPERMRAHDVSLDRGHGDHRGRPGRRDPVFSRTER